MDIEYKDDKVMFKTLAISETFIYKDNLYIKTRNFSEAIHIDGSITHLSHNCIRLKDAGFGFMDGCLLVKPVKTKAIVEEA